MQIDLYYTRDDRHKVHKDLTSIQNCVGALKDECSMNSPKVIIEMAEATASRANYAVIHDLDILRYYFITDQVMYRDGLVQLSMELDPLMTYETEIRNLVCTVERNQNDSDSYLIDENYMIDAYSKYVTYDFPNGFPSDQDTYVLMTVGSGAVVPPDPS